MELLLDTSAITNASESSASELLASGDYNNEVSFDTDVWEISLDDIDIEEEADDPTLVLELKSFPNPSLSTCSSSSFDTPPEVVEVKCKRRRRKKALQRTSPYAQLCFDPNYKTLVTMLEIDICNGRRKKHSRLPLDAPSLEDYFPWLHNSEESEDNNHDQDGIPGLTSSSFSWGSNSSSVSGLTETKDDPAQNAYHEPIVLSGWMMDTDSMSDEEADIYWLLHDGEDVWVKIDDNCAKALRKMFSCCGHWKLLKKSSKPSRRQEHSDAREEKRLRYSMLS